MKCRRFLSILLVLTTLFTLFTFGAHADSYVYITSPSDGETTGVSPIKVSFRMGSHKSYRYSVRDLTTNTVILDKPVNSTALSASFTISSSYLVNNHSYKVWVGLYDEKKAAGNCVAQDRIEFTYYKETIVRLQAPSITPGTSKAAGISTSAKVRYILTSTSSKVKSVIVHYGTSPSSLYNIAKTGSVSPSSSVKSVTLKKLTAGTYYYQIEFVTTSDGSYYTEVDEFTIHECPYCTNYIGSLGDVDVHINKKHYYQ